MAKSFATKSFRTGPELKHIPDIESVIIRILKITALALAFLMIAGISGYLTLTMIIKSEDTVIVPDLVSKDVIYALELLTDLELNTKVKGSEFSNDITKNHVIYQNPSPGSEIKKGRDVRIIISKGPKLISMPQLITLPIQQAILILEENALCRGNISKTHHKNITEDQVIAQTPSAGSMIPRETCVDLLVSSGSRKKAFKMPDLSGLSLDEAIHIIERVNLNVGEINSSFRKNKPRRIIVDQNPLPGYRVVIGSIVNLSINRKATAKRPAGSHRQKTGSLFRYRVQNGFLKRRIRVRLNSEGFTNEIFDEFVKPGKEIWLLIPTDSDATVFLYEDDKLLRTETYESG
jgi:serine/threonine-protein kinase